MKTFQTKNQQVYEALRAAIISGEIAPGDRISIRQVARQFEVSDIPVREALKALAGENLVQIVPYAGAVATPISGRNVAEMGEIRLVLEPWGTRLAATQLSPHDLGQLGDYLAEMDRAVASGDVTGFASADRAFHGLIFARCVNQRLGELLTSLWMESERNVLGLRRLPDHAARSQEEHRALFSALERRDEEAAEEAAHRHRLGLLERLRSLIEEQPQPAAGSGGK